MRPARADDWPQWRGPNREDKSAEKGLLKEWPKDGPPLVWKATGIGTGFSGVSVAGGKIFTMGQQKDSTFVYALDENAKEGVNKVLWSTEIGKPSNPGGFPGTRCTPTVDGDRVYVLSQEGELACLKAADGKMVWHKSFKDDFNGGEPHWGFAESPLVDGDRLICTPGGKEGTLLALDKKTGEKLWRTADWKDGAQYSSPIAVEMGGQRQYIQLTMENVAGVDAGTGKVLWKAPRKGGTAVITTPVFHDGYVYVTSSYGVGCDLFKVTGDNGVYKAEPVYTHDTNKVMANHHGGVILLDDKIYGCSGDRNWVCQDLKTGEKVWEQDKGTPGKGSLAYADGHFYLRGEGSPSIVALIEATPKGYEEKGRFTQPDRSKGHAAWPHPVIANGKLYLRDQDVLLCYDLKAGESK